MVDTQQGFLPEYRNILNKSKKRFLRKPNVSEASEQFQQLGKRLEDNQEPQYAAYCHLAQGKCQVSEDRTKPFKDPTLPTNNL